MWVLSRLQRRTGGKRGNTAGTIARLAGLFVAATVSMPWMTFAQQTSATTGSGASAVASSVSASAPNIAWYYGDKPPVGQLRAFDAVVVEPGHGFDPTQFKTPSTQWLAYVSLGEVTPERGWFKALPKAWLLGDNAAWASRVVDQAQPEWPAFYVDHVIKPLWDKGYRGFFLDTLDSYQLVAKDDASRAAQEAGMVRVIRAIKARYPDAKLIFNRGFEILPQVHDQVYAVAFESLYRGWDQGAKHYKEVNDADRAWLMGQARRIRDEYHLPVISIDYCPPADRACARDTAKRIKAQGLVPYVTDPALSTIGVGRIACAKRRVTAGATILSLAFCEMSSGTWICAGLGLLVRPNPLHGAVFARSTFLKLLRSAATPRIVPSFGLASKLMQLFCDSRVTIPRACGPATLFIGTPKWFDQLYSA